MKLLKRKSVVPLGAVVLASLLVSTAAVLLTKKKPNVILITVDTLRADHLGAYGYTRNTSPHLDRFAHEALLFRYAFSQAPGTCPSLSSLMTSYYPHETKVLSNLHILQSQVVTLAEMLQAQGYRTAAIVSNFVLRRGSGFEQGFEIYDDAVDDPRPTAHIVERIAPKTSSAAIAWLEHQARSPFFLWVHYMDPHGPYMPPIPYTTLFVEQPGQGTLTLPLAKEWISGKGGIPPYQVLGEHRDPAYYIAQYDGEIRFFDEAFGVLIEKIRALGFLKNSVVIVTADHGEGMGEHDYYFAHEETLYNGLLRVPLLMWLPGKAVKTAKTVEYPVRLLDVLPTVLDLLSIKMRQKFRGRHLLVPRERAIFAETHVVGDSHALLFRGLKLIVSSDASALYDMRRSSLETRNLLTPDMDTTLAAHVSELRAQLDAIRHRDALRLGRPVESNFLQEEKKKFQALGYLH